MRKKFLKAILLRSTDKLMEKDNSIAKIFWQVSADLLMEPDAIDDQAQAHGEGRLPKINLCDTCMYDFPDCIAISTEVTINGIDIIECHSYKY